MNPRLFCRERSYHKALLLTYSFDPVFFEQVVLSDLWAGRSCDIVVIGDRKQIEASTQATAGQLWHLGKHYLLAGANHIGAFHPKVLLRLGPKDGMIMLGSGNITSSGWGGNQELGTAWMLGPDYPDKGEWLRRFLDDVLSWCEGEFERDAIRRLKDAPWLSLTPSTTETSSPVLYSRYGQALGPLLAQRWAGRQFDEVRILTGSTDESGAFLRWAHLTFGIQRATVALTPTMASFVPEKLADLPVELRLIEAPTDRPLHAKFYWFEGPSGTAAVMGSANCSAAAWLLPPDQRGNVETVVVYDAPDAADFESVLSILRAPFKSPADLLLPKQAVTNDQQIARRKYELMGLRWNSADRCLRAILLPSPSSESRVELLLGGKQFNMMCLDTSEGHWKCELIEGVGTSTVFASIRITEEGLHWITLPRWIDDLVALEHASQSARLLESFRGFDRNTTSVERRQMLIELQEVAHSLFHETESFRDPVFGDGRINKAKEAASVAPINPQDLVFHLEETHESLRQLGSSHSGTLSLTGILRLLFDADDDHGGSNAAAGDEDIDEGQLPDDHEKLNSKKGPEKNDKPCELASIEDKFRVRLEMQISEFLNKLSSPTFAERCTATQMVQAISFPLAIALRGQKQGWVSEALSEKWSLDIFSILFRGAGNGGLLRTVEQRYELNDRIETFHLVVGDGTLWMVLIATLGNAQWHGIGTDIDKAIALREVFNASQLLVSANSHRISGLLGRIRIDDARKFVAEIAPRVSELLDQIESILRPTWKSDIDEQLAQGIEHKVGDLFWRDKVGWAICLEDGDTSQRHPIKVRLQGREKSVMGGYYVNVTSLLDKSPSLLDLISRLRSEVSVSE